MIMNGRIEMSTLFDIAEVHAEITSVFLSACFFDAIKFTSPMLVNISIEP